MRRLRVAIVQQSAWDAGRDALPLAAGYLAAAVKSHTALNRDVEVDIISFRGGVDTASMALRLLAGGPPDVLACSVMGWSFRAFGTLAEAFRQANPEGVVIWGGPHVANQGERVFRLFPAVNVVVNGEGEFVFLDLLAAMLAERPANFTQIDGISFNANGSAVTTAPPVRVLDLEAIASPFLTGVLPLTGQDGAFAYDVALMETNRGCPYACAMCFWGGAIGQKVRRFGRERLREELAVLGRAGAAGLVLCDANFGAFEEDLAFVEDVIRMRERFGFPKTLDTAWAKNKSGRFFEAARMMRQAGLASSFTLALQSLDDGVLEAMGRRNMRINAWEDLAGWLRDQGFDAYGELIWGAPGETAETFLAGYNRLSRVTSRIAVYPLQILPNTAYATERERHGLMTVRSETDDFEYVLSHAAMSLEDNVRVQDFLFWARTVGEHMLLRYTWSALRRFAKLEQGDALRRLTAWVATSSHPAALRLKDRPQVFVTAEVVSWQLRRIYGERGFASMLRAWWDEDILPLIAPSDRAIATEAFEFDQLCRPVWEAAGASSPLPVRRRSGLDHFVREATIRDIPASATAWDAGWSEAAAEPRAVRIWYRRGFRDFVDSHEMAAHFFGKPDWARPSVQAAGGLANVIM